MAVGVRRTTFSDVARVAGISRMTLYRRFPDLPSVLAALIARDLGAIVAGTLAEVEHLATARERLAEALVRGAEAMTRDPLVLRILEVDPELLLPYVIDRIGETQRAVLDVLERYIAEGQRDGSIAAATRRSWRPVWSCRPGGLCFRRERASAHVMPSPRSISCG